MICSPAASLFLPRKKSADFGWAPALSILLETPRSLNVHWRLLLWAWLGTEPCLSILNNYINRQNSKFRLTWMIPPRATSINSNSLPIRQNFVMAFCFFILTYMPFFLLYWLPDMSYKQTRRTRMKAQGQSQFNPFTQSWQIITLGTWDKQIFDWLL